MNGSGPLAVYPLAVRRIEGPGAVEFQPAARPDTRLLNLHGVKRLDRVQLNDGKPRRDRRGFHARILTKLSGQAALEKRLCGNLTRDVKLAEDRTRKNGAAQHSDREAQQRADQKIFGKMLRFELGITGNSLRSENEPGGARRLKQQRGEQEEALEPADVKSGVLHGPAAFCRRVELDAFRQRTS